MSPTISAGFFSATYYPVEQLKAELSFRTEYTSLNRKVNFSPRLALNYYWGDVVLSALRDVIRSCRRTTGWHAGMNCSPRYVCSIT